MSLGSKGKILSNETKKKISIKVKGENNPMFGKTHSEVARKKMSLSKKGRTPWNKGKSYKTGRIPWNKGKSYTITKKPQIDE